MMEEMIVYAWGLVILASLYHGMHQVIYSEALNIGAGVMIFHMWAYENIAILRPQIAHVQPYRDDPMVYRYGGMTTLHFIGFIGILH